MINVSPLWTLQCLSSGPDQMLRQPALTAKRTMTRAGDVNRDLDRRAAIREPTPLVQEKNGRSATWSDAVMCSASNDAVRITAGHDEFRGSGPHHLAAQFVPWPSRVFPIPA